MMLRRTSGRPSTLLPSNRLSSSELKSDLADFPLPVSGTLSSTGNPLLTTVAVLFELSLQTTLTLPACSGFILLRAYGKCIYRYQTEENCYDAVNKFNIYPYQIPSWLVDFMPNRGGHLIGNIQPANMNFRLFSLGNFWSINYAKWTELVADMPFKICYPATECEEWKIITGSDQRTSLGLITMEVPGQGQLCYGMYDQR
ncbi:hypothetical protein IGI04_005199 [Brassica rapa subsp. trilocularis]|uniref:Alkaline/neutral invertase n=1 Tax=Brassica rapa subsp. trilocularis TaxID=1813537 RepID=A0ABQ7NFQ5_BRACM|nr:hypothetical protein IGI04_005199 [Brassica rapa subsp. trilocularis]